MHSTAVRSDRHDVLRLSLRIQAWADFLHQIDRISPTGARVASSVQINCLGSLVDEYRIENGVDALRWLVQAGAGPARIN